MWHAAGLDLLKLGPSIQRNQVSPKGLVMHAAHVGQLQPAVLQHLLEHMWLQWLLVVPASDVCCMSCLHLWRQHACSCLQQL
jgi:hypothetical protein